MFVPFVIVSRRQESGGACARTTRNGQDKLADIQNILHETITGNRIVKAFGMETWEIGALPRTPPDACSAPTCDRWRRRPMSSPLMDIFGAIAIALLLLLGRNADQDRRIDRRHVHRLHHRGLQAL